MTATFCKTFCQTGECASNGDDRSRFADKRAPTRFRDSHHESRLASEVDPALEPLAIELRVWRSGIWEQVQGPI